LATVQKRWSIDLAHGLVRTPWTAPAKRLSQYLRRRGGRLPVPS